MQDQESGDVIERLPDSLVDNPHSYHALKLVDELPGDFLSRVFKDLFEDRTLVIRK